MADERVEIRVRLTPRAAVDQVVPLEDGSLAVRVTAPPIDGRANDALVRVVAKALGLAPSRVALVRGARSRTKTLRVTGEQLEARLAALRGGGAAP